MERREFYVALSKIPSKRWQVVDNKILTERKGKVFNPITAVAHSKGLGIFNNNKRDTMRAGTALGLPRTFTENVYDATTGVYNRGNVQVVRGRIRSAVKV